MAHTNPQRSVLRAWQEYNGKPCGLGTEVVAFRILQDFYPNHHITRTLSKSCDLLGYAAAGFATAHLELADGCDATRTYRSGGSRISGKPGTLSDDVDFGCRDYLWEGQKFITYEFSWLDPVFGRMSYMFVLAEHTEFSAEGRHPGTDALLLAAGQWTKELHDEIYVFDSGMWWKNKPLYKIIQTSSWDDVVLDATTKTDINNDVHGFFDSRGLYAKYGVTWKRGIIVHGPPGNGKSMCIKALISTLSKREDPVPSLYVKSLHSNRGQKWCIGEIFARARAVAPCLLVFEDLDSLVKDETRSYFLNEVDGLESNDGILMIGSTNHLARLDSAIAKRPSRFDRKYRFNLPNEKERAAYCRYWRPKLTEAVSFPDEACELVAKITEGFSFAYLKELFVSTLLLLARGGPDGSEDPIGVGDKADHATESRSSDDGEVVEKPTEANSETSDKQEDQEAAQKRPVKQKSLAYSLEIPESLADNALVKALVSQTKVLLEQMDDSGNDRESKKTGSELVGATAGSGPDFLDHLLNDSCESLPRDVMPM